jgi:alpha-tubulin suppressor-like RCC1 family protein
VVRCWGDNQYSQLGQGPNGVAGRIGDDEPASVGADVDVGGSALQVAGGKYSSCAILTGGKLRCWGGAALGYPPPEQYIGDDETPASAGDVNVGGTVTSVTMGLQHTCALLSSQSVRCWGTGVSHQLGYANTGNIVEADAGGDVDVGGPVQQLAAGRNHSCAVLTSGAVRCWGNNGVGELGYARIGNVSMFETPASNGDVSVGGTVKQMTAGGTHSCALLESGAVRCWGENQYGQLGYGNTTNVGDTETPASAGDVDVGGEVEQLVAGERHTCALLVGGGVRCWGTGSLGYPNELVIGDDETPASVGDIDLGGPASQIAAGGNHTCALLPGGTVRCWGSAYKGELGYGAPLVGDVGDNETPAGAGDVPFR